MKILQTTLVTSLLAFSGHSIAQTINDDFTPYDENATETGESADNSSFISRKTSYDYVYFAYRQWKSFDDDWTGPYLEGGYGILPTLSVWAGFGSSESDNDADSSDFSIGLDYHQARTNKMDLIGSFSLTKGESEYYYDSVDSFQYSLSGGARYFVNDKLDISGVLRHYKTEYSYEDNDDTTTTGNALGMRARYFVSSTVELGASLFHKAVKYTYAESQSYEQIGIRARAYVTPKASIGLSYSQANSRSDYSYVSLNASYDFKPIH